MLSSFVKICLPTRESEGKKLRQRVYKVLRWINFCFCESFLFLSFSLSLLKFRPFLLFVACIRIYKIAGKSLEEDRSFLMTDASLDSCFLSVSLSVKLPSSSSLHRNGHGRDTTASRSPREIN